MPWAAPIVTLILGVIGFALLFIGSHYGDQAVVRRIQGLNADRENRLSRWFILGALAFLLAVAVIGVTAFVIWPS